MLKSKEGIVSSDIAIQEINKNGIGRVDVTRAGRCEAAERYLYFLR